ncbi:MAG: NAD(P)H-dependent oxidoreductase [Flavobacteriaceae bacterium]
MKLLLFNGAPESSVNGISHTIIAFFASYFKEKNVEIITYNLSENKLPLLEIPFGEIPENVRQMTEIFTQSDVQIWLSPLYHGAIPGSMKNCMDWLELTARDSKPYLTNQIISLVCWADGVQAMQGINNMDAIAKALRAWVLPYSVPVVRKDILVDNQLNPVYKQRFSLMANLIEDAGKKFGL